VTVGPERQVPDTERAVRAPGDAVESAVGHVSRRPRSQRVLGEALVAGVSATVVAIARRFRR
jgi:hypothetical protein